MTFAYYSNLDKPNVEPFFRRPLPTPNQIGKDRRISQHACCSSLAIHTISLHAGCRIVADTWQAEEKVCGATQ